MDKRNWSDLSRKLVDRYDMKYTSDAYQSILGKYAYGFWGKGVLPTTFFPNPFQVSQSNSDLTLTISDGVAFDNTGLLVEIPAINVNTVLAIAGDSTNPRCDLLVLRYKESNDTLIPKPSDPIINVYLNLVDDFELVIRQGIAAPSPNYPSAQAGDIILAGLQVPANATLASQISIDTSIRDLARVNFTEQAVFHNEPVSGVIDASNRTFTLSANPYGANSLFLFRDRAIVKKTEYTLSGNTITMNVAPILGQELQALYVEESPTSVNPLAGDQEEPTGTINGTTGSDGNATFQLSGKPADAGSLSVYKNRAKVPPNKYQLNQTSGVYSITFFAGEIPVLGQDLYVTYFVNPATVGVGADPASPDVFGSDTNPILIDPTIGIQFSSTKSRVVIFVKSTGGAISISANPQISAPAFIGQELEIIGCDNTDSIKINQNINGVTSNGNKILKLDDSITFTGKSTTWNEKGRR